MMTRAEHLAWAKERALEYVDDNDLPGAVSSIISDLNKHPDFKPMAIQLMTADAMLFTINRGAAAVRHWIKGFN